MASYTRQSSFADGDTITAALFNNEFNQLVNALHNSTGHKHDGTAAEGPVIGLIGDAGETAPNNKVLIDTVNNFVEFYVEVSSAPVQQLYIADGAIIPVTDSDIDLGTSSLYFKNAYIDSITTTGNVAVGGNLTVTGTTTFNGGTITMGDAATDNVVFGADVDSNIIPDDDDTYDLGSSSQEWRNLYIDGTANIDSLVADTADINAGTIDGATIATSDITVGAGKTLDVSAGTLTLADNQISGDKVEGGTINATTITTLASTTGNITTVNSTATNATTVDTTNIEVTNLKAKDGTAAGSIADTTGVVTLASSVLTTTDINGGTIDGSTIATSDITVGASKTLDVSAGTLTLADNQISGDKVEGGTIAATTITDLTFGSLNDGTITATAFVDEDNMASDSATLIPTQQSVKAYVDSQVTAQDLDFQGDTGGALSIDLDSEALTIAGGTGLDTVGSGNTVTVNIDSTVATLTGSQTLTNKTIDVDNNTVSNIEVDNLKAGVLDTDLSSVAATDTTLASAKAIKTYVDAQVTAQDLDLTDGTTTIAIDLDSETLSVLGGTGVTSTASGNGVTLAIGQAVGATDNVSFGTVTAALTGNASTATALATARTIGGVSFDGTANIVPTTFAASTFSGDLNVDSGVLFADVSTNRVGINQTVPDVSLDLGANTDAIHVPSGTTGERPGSPAAGYFRYNSETGDFEGYTDAWGAIAGSGGTAPTIDTMTGDGSDTTLTLTSAPVNENATVVTIDGVVQHKDTYSVSSNTLTFSTAPPTGTAVECITWTNTAINSALLMQDADGDTQIQVEESSDEDKIRFDTAGTERMVIDNSGKVGIGTTSPDATGLHVHTGSAGSLTPNSAADDLVVESNGNAGITIASPDANYSGIIFSSPSDTTGSIIEYNQSGATFDIGTSTSGGVLRLRSGNFSEAMRIDSSGNVVIGTTAQIAGGLVSMRQGSATHALVLDSATSTAPSLYLRTVGGTATQAKITFGDSTSLVFTTTSAERMRIDSSGNVGIGTSSPAHTLDVVGVSRFVGNVDVYSTTGGAVNSSLLYFGSAALPEAGAIYSKTDSATAGNLVLATAESGTGTITERLRITSTGNVGIGTSSPQTPWITGTASTLSVVNSAKYTGLDIKSYSTSFNHCGAIALGHSKSATINTQAATTTGDFIGSVSFEGVNSSSAVTAGAYIFAEQTGVAGATYIPSALKFATSTGSAAAAERMRIDSSGNLNVGCTDGNSLYNNSGTNDGAGILANGQIQQAVYQDVVHYVNRTGNDGTITSFQKDGTTVGSISSTATGGGSIIIGNDNSGIMFRGDLTGSAFIPADPSTGTQVDNSLDVGHSVIRFQDIYATNGTIQTSDRNEKQDIEALTDAETRVAVAAKGLLRKYRWKSAVAKKGNEARTHFGIIAQDLQDAFTAEGLDARDYAMFISTTWTDDDGEEQTRLGVRYSQLLAFIIAAI